MADREKFWAAPPDWRTAEIRRETWAARRLTGLGQILVSGKIDQAVASVAPGSKEVGLWAFADADFYSVRIARDRALVVAPSPGFIEPGWRGEGWAASPADDVYAILEIAGRGVRDLVCEATAADLDAGSRSAAILFAGVTGLLYRTGAETARFHVESPFATYAWSWLEGRG